MSDYIGIPISAENLIFAQDDSIVRCYDGATSLINLANPSRGAGVLANGTIENGMIRYNGTNTRIVYPDSYILNGSPEDIDCSNTGGGDEEYTIEAWVKILADVSGDTTSGWQIIGNNGTTGIGIQLMRNGGENKINFGYRTNSNDYSVGLDMQIDTWYHVVGTRGPLAGVTIYANTVQYFNSGYVSNDMDVDCTTDTMNVGQTSARITGYFNGYMPVIRIYKRELSALEVVANYEAQKARFV